MVVLNYFGILVPEIKEIDQQLETDLNAGIGCLYGIGLAGIQAKDHFTYTDLMLNENPVTPTLNDLQVEAYKDEELLIKSNKHLKIQCYSGK